jgi:UDP:flavonoid glycosyltransferase YjiC (YdhE family)
MKIGIQTWGSDGDVRPFIALAAGLRAAGHDVTVAATHVENKNYTAVAEALGFPVRQVGHLDPKFIVQAGERLAAETNAVKQVHLAIKYLFDPLASDILEAAKGLCREHDLVIGHFIVHPLKTVAEQARRPYVPVFTAPMIPSAYTSPTGSPLPLKFLNILLWKLGELLMARLFLPSINAMRRSEGLAPLRRAMGDPFSSPILNLVAVSPALYPPPPDWRDEFRICGAFTFPEEAEPWQMPDPLRRFLETGPAPVYMTFGSMSVGDPAFADTIRMLAEASLRAGCRAIIQTNGTPHDGAPRSPDLYYLSRAPHHLLFPQCAAVVHHGGAGTTHSASRAGLPSIVVEHATDQAFWGTVLFRAGIAPRPLHRRTVTVKALARAISAVLSSPAMQEKARRIGSVMQQEDGVKRAVALIEERMAGRT